MPPDVPRAPAPAARATTSVLALLALVCACTAPNPRPDPGFRADPLHAPAADAEASRQYLVALAELAQSPPARQAELLRAARDEAEATPTTTNRLRYALMLADPGTVGGDAVAARRQLSEILARPEWALPSERALAALVLRSVDARLAAEDAARRARVPVGTPDRERIAALNRRVATEVDENARLKKALDEAQKKLDAISQLERAGKERADAQGGT